MGELDGLTAFVTGAGSGIGRATMQLFASEGARVAGMDRQSDSTRKLTAMLSESGYQVAGYVGDVTIEADVELAVNSTIDAFGGLDIVVNNAGVGLYGRPLEGTLLTEWEHVIRTNLTSQFLVSKSAIPHLRNQGGGSIVNVASVHAMASSAGVAAYAASKGAVVALSRQMALDLAVDRVRVNSLVVGPVDTGMLRQHAQAAAMTFEELGWTSDEHAIGRIARPEEIAAAAMFLASPRSSFVTGTSLVVDGGLLARL